MPSLLIFLIGLTLSLKLNVFWLWFYFLIVLILAFNDLTLALRFFIILAIFKNRSFFSISESFEKFTLLLGSARPKSPASIGKGACCLNEPQKDDSWELSESWSESSWENTLFFSFYLVEVYIDLIPRKSERSLLCSV